MSKVLAVLSGNKEEAPEPPAKEPIVLDSADKFKKVLVNTIVRWASETFIENPILIREMFRWVEREPRLTEAQVSEGRGYEG